MKKFRLSLLFILLTTYSVLAQDGSSKPPLKIVIRENYNTPEFKNRLVDLALKNTVERKILKLQTGISKEQLSKSKIKWLDYIALSGNVNEFTIDPPELAGQTQNLFYPRYNFGLNFSFGSLFTNAYDTKIAKKNVAIAEEQEKNAPMLIRSAVLSKFEDYMLARELLKLQGQIENDEEAVYNLSERKFKINEMSLSEFNDASKRLYGERFKKIEMKRNLSVFKYELEALTGVMIEDSILL